MFTKRASLLRFTATVIILAGLAAPAAAEVTFYIQREGSPGDNGLALFTAAAANYVVQNFEDPALRHAGGALPSVPVGAFVIAATSAFADGTPYTPTIAYSAEFAAPGKIYSIALVAVTTLVLTPSADQPVGAIGAWIFDDGGALDSVYLVEVVELNGFTAQALLANEIPLNRRYHEIEGFIGATSTVGIARFRIMAVNPTTLQVQNDTLEIDYLTVAPLPTPVETTPQIVCPPPVFSECASQAGTAEELTAHVEDADGDALSVTWLVDGQVVQEEQVLGGPPPTSADVTLAQTYAAGTHTVEIVVSDGQPELVSCSTSVTVQDTIPPTILTCAANQMVDANADCQAEIPDLTGQVEAADDCGLVTVSQDPPAGTVVGLGDTSVTLTVTDGTGLTATCDATVTVVDATPPSILTCAADQTVDANADCQAGIPDLTGQVEAADDCGLVTVSQDPPAGTVVELGDTSVTLTVTDGTGLTATCDATVTVVDATLPAVSCSVATTMLWPANHNLVNVGLGAAISDNCDSGLTTQVLVYGDEDDEEATGDGNFSPDAKDLALGTLLLRAERKGNADGRVYLIVVEATDSSGNTGFRCATVVVPHSKSPASIAAVNAQAAAARDYCLAHDGTPPPGYFVIGDGPGATPDDPADDGGCNDGKKSCGHRHCKGKDHLKHNPKSGRSHHDAPPCKKSKTKLPGR